ncbi:MAG: hypothetical protein WA431_17845 [Candidatus Cybelea sp.]
MESLELLHAKIHGFPGYDTALERRHSDEYVRSYLGERLSEMAARCTLPPDLQAPVDALLLRVAFANPKDFNAHDVDGLPVGDDGALAATDAATIELADRAETMELASVAAYLDDVTVALDRRDDALRAIALKTT